MFDTDKSYIDEGEFNDDDLNGTFGRRIFMKSGDKDKDGSQFGWFTG